MARPKTPTKTLESIAECTAAMRELLNATLEQERLETDRDQAASAVMKSYEARIGRAAETRSDIEQQLQQYYLTHLKEVEKDGKKSISLTYGEMGRRLTPAALKLLNRAWTWAAVLAKLQERFKMKFVRVADPEVDKEKVKAEIAEADLAEFGLKLQQDEKFFVEVTRPKQEGL